MNKYNSRFNISFAFYYVTFCFSFLDFSCVGGVVRGQQIRFCGGDYLCQLHDFCDTQVALLVQEIIFFFCFSFNLLLMMMMDRELVMDNEHFVIVRI